MRLIFRKIMRIFERFLLPNKRCSIFHKGKLSRDHLFSGLLLRRRNHVSVGALAQPGHYLPGSQA